MPEDDSRTTRWQRISSAAIAVDPIHALRTAIVKIRANPRDAEARRQLRALASEQGMWEQLAALLGDEARAADGKPALAAVFWSELADIHENLDQPIEEIAALEMVVTIAPDQLEHHDRLAKLYHRSGAWGKAAEAFERVAALAQDDRARAALRAAGRLYREHGRADRAIETYRAIVARKPGDLDAWRALDELLTAAARWAEVAVVRGELAERAASSIDKALQLRAQARALEQAGDPTGAAKLVANAAQHAPDDVSGLVDYATVLARGGKGREAADVLVMRIAEASALTPKSGEVASLRLRLVGILDDTVGDHVAADVVLDELLAAAPEYEPALAQLVARAERAGDVRTHAAALLRHAGALADPRERAGGFAAAARRYREARDLRECARAFEAAVDVAPDDRELARELDDARTALAVERATADLASGKPDAAEARLRALLDDHPLDLAANLALADLLMRTGRPSDASEHLRATLAAAPDDMPPARLAPLVFAYARAAAAGGEDDEAHQLLHEAHHLDRRDLAITLALGESCFRRKLWREAAIHLGGLADHPDAPNRAADVARGLVHAARAEVRALRPTNAGKHYEAAVRLDPTCALAWHALGELARERDDTTRAFECFEREAAATSDPRERVKLYDALGDLARTSLGDAARAERCYAAVVAHADAPVLEKLLALQRARGAGSPRGETCQRLAELANEPRARREFLEEAAQAFSADGDRARARAVADRLVADHPLDVDAIVCATSVVLDAHDHVRAAQWLRRALPVWDAGGDRGQDDPRRAELWRRLGDCERALGDGRAALAAYQRAIATEPQSDGALAARRALVELAASDGRPAGDSLAALVEVEYDAADVLAYARELDGSGRRDDATAMFELAYALDGSRLGDDEAARATTAVLMASDEAYGTRLSDADRRALIDDPDDSPLADLLELVGEAAPLLALDTRTALERAGVSDAKKLAVTGETAVAATYPQVANALGGPVTLLFANARGDSADVELVLASPPIVVIGGRMLSIRARSHGDAHPYDLQLRFQLGRVVELARARRALAAANEPAAFARLIAALPFACGRGGAAPEGSGVRAEADRLRQVLPAQLRRRIGERWPSSPPDPAAYVAACTRAADRAGLLACGHVGVAIELAGGPRAARHLVELAASPRYLAARRALRPRRG